MPRNVRHSSKAKAVFLDRDGTIIKQVENIVNVRQLRLLPGAAVAIKTLNRLGYRVIIVTNQPVVARGLVSEQGLHGIHEDLLNRLLRRGSRIDGLYYCPHHPNADLEAYRVDCMYRKPKPGMIRKAAREFDIDPKQSFLVGDHAWDIMAGQRAGVKTILVKTSERSNDPKYTHIKPNFVAKNLLEAVKVIKQHGT